MTGAAAAIKAAKIKTDPKLTYKVLENSGNAADLRRQQKIYGRLGYEVVHSDDAGIIVAMPKEMDKARRQKAQQLSKDRMGKPAPTELPQAQNVKDTAESTSTGLGSFLESDDTD